MARFKKNKTDINVESVNNSRQELFKLNDLKTEIASCCSGEAEFISVTRVPFPV